MTKETKVNVTSGLDFGGLLAVLFIGLKLAHVISWSWWWVLSPLWIPLAVAGVVLVVGAVVALAVVALK